MRKTIDGVRRVARERQHLSCHTCGAGNPLESGAVERGFQRCGHCRSAMPIDGAGGYAFDGHGFTLVVSPGRSSFVLLYGRLFSLPGWFVFLLAGEVASRLAGHVLGRVVGPEVAWLPAAAFVVAAVMLFLLVCVEQRVLLVNNRIEVSWRLFGASVLKRRFGTYDLTAHVRSRWPCGLLLRSRAGSRAWIGTDSAHEAQSLGSEIEVAIRETRQPVGSERLRCPGCGAPVASRLEVVGRGGVECGHCRAALVAVKGGVVLGECRIGHDLAPEHGRKRPRRLDDGGRVEWRLASELARDPARALAYWSVGLLLGGISVLIGAGITLLAEGLRSFGVIFALIFVPLGLGLLYYFTVSFFGRHRLALDATVLEHELYVGPLRVRHKLVPLPRLLSLQAKRGPMSIDLVIETPLDEVEIELPDPRNEGAAVALDLVTAVRDRVRAMERDVVWCGESAATAVGVRSPTVDTDKEDATRAPVAALDR